MQLGNLVRYVVDMPPASAVANIVAIAAMEAKGLVGTEQKVAHVFSHVRL